MVIFNLKTDRYQGLFHRKITKLKIIIFVHCTGIGSSFYQNHHTDIKLWNLASRRTSLRKLTVPDSVKPKVKTPSADK